MTIPDTKVLAEKMAKHLWRLDEFPIDEHELEIIPLALEDDANYIQRELDTLAKEVVADTLLKEAEYWDEQESQSTKAWHQHELGGLGGGEQPEVWKAFSYSAKDEAKRLRQAAASKREEK